MTAEDVPVHAFQPSQTGDGSVESFSAFLDGVNDMREGLVLGAPVSVDHLTAMSQVVVHGHVAEVALVRSDVHMGDLSAQQIEMVITVADPAIVKSSASVTAVDTWRQQLWLGDPVLAGRVLEMLQAELGSGPVGADAVLFGTIDQTVERSLPTPSVLDGLITLDGSVARLAPSPETPSDTTQTLDAFSDARSVVVAIQDR
ncbi:MAG: hypothetical protein JXA83_09665 [Acidimicrobiales bacterium]|nr:hypothetical protein [Acidimicrobiales bacterium]